MNTYEALLILKPLVDIDNSDVALKGVENLIENQKGKVLRVEKMGRKRLGYEIGKFKDAFVATVYLEMSPAAVVDFRRACHLNEDILRLTLVRRCPQQMAQEALRPPRPERPERPERGDRRPPHDRPPHDRGGDRFPRQQQSA